MSFYDRFTQLCKEWGKSPSAVARESGIHKTAPTSWKRGIYPSQKSVRKLAAYFNVSEDYLLGRGVGSVSAKGKDPSPIILSLDKSYFYDDMKLSEVGIGESGKVSLSFEIHESG